MSNLYFDGLKVKVIDKKETKEQVIMDLKEMCDEDFNGNNGVEYTSEEAIELGYHSDMEYYFNYFLNKDFNIGKAMELTLRKQYSNNRHYYVDYEVFYQETENEYVLATSATYRI